MKKIFLTMLIAGFICILNQISANATALFYTNATYPVTATGLSIEDLQSLKKGKSSSTNILFLVETGDAGIDRAAKNGGITKISHIDDNDKMIFIFWRKITVTVYGE